MSYRRSALQSSRVARHGRPRPAHLAHCPVTRKVRFRDKSEAVDFLHRAATARAFGATCRRECRSYRCTHCSGWHVTSVPVRSIATTA